jgi:hypothetical protein
LQTFASDFSSDARRSIESFRRSLLAALDGVMDGTGRRLTDLAATLAIDTKLAWKLTRILELHDPYSAGLYMPGSAGYRILRQAIERRGVAEDEIVALDRAYRGFEDLQRDHAGDRRTLDMLFSGLAEQEQNRRELEHRKAAFHANTSLWGVRAAMRLMTFVIAESAEDPTRVDAAHVAGLFGVQRTRPNVPWRVAQLRSHDAAGRPVARVGSIPIDPEVLSDAPPRLIAHCSGPVPELCPVTTADGRTEYRLGDGPVGRSSVFDLVFAERMPLAGSRYRAPGDDALSVTSRNRTPVERLVLDLVVSRTLAESLELSVMLFSELWGERNTINPDDPERLPLAETIRHVGTGLSGFQHRHVPRHAELMSRVFTGCGWDPDLFETYRVEMQYPPAPTGLRIMSPLPDAPG